MATVDISLAAFVRSKCGTQSVRDENKARTRVRVAFSNIVKARGLDADTSVKLLQHAMDAVEYDDGCGLYHEYIEQVEKVEDVKALLDGITVWMKP